MGIIAKGAKCKRYGCDKDGIRSLTTSKVEGTGLSISGSSKKTVLCRNIIRNGKKQQKKIEMFERARYDRF